MAVPSSPLWVTTRTFEKSLSQSCSEPLPQPLVLFLKRKRIEDWFCAGHQPVCVGAPWLREVPGPRSAWPSLCLALALPGPMESPSTPALALPPPSELFRKATSCLGSASRNSAPPGGWSRCRDSASHVASQAGGGKGLGFTSWHSHRPPNFLFLKKRRSLKITALILTKLWRI